jgi:nucleotide-binding universal stress UspA family protein
MFRTILVPLDGSALAEQALDVARGIAQACHADIELVLARHATAVDGHAGLLNEKAREEEHYIQRLAGELTRRTGLPVHGAVAIGQAEDVIGHHARELEADLIIMTTHGRTGVSRAWLGSVADSIARTSAIPVLLFRAESAATPRARGESRFRRILVPIDGSTTSSAILQPVAELARAIGATVTLARVVEPVPIYVFDPNIPAYATPAIDDAATRQVADEVRKDLTSLAERIENEYGLRLETIVEVAKHVGPALVRLAIAERADLVAMTTHGRRASRLVLGSVADKLLRGSRLPLLVLHPAAASVSARASSDAAVPAQAEHDEGCTHRVAND